MNRDKTIDRLRGFAMLWVIVVHVLYWGKFFNNGFINLLQSFSLFEMPLFFFITGASNSFSKTNSYFDFVNKRFQRILIPYWFFAIICAVLSIIRYSMTGDLGFIGGVKVLLSWIIPINEQMTSLTYLTWALWFVPVYLCVVLIIPLLKTIKQSIYRIRFVFLLVGVFGVTCLFKMKIAQYISFYTLWTYTGLFYNEIKYAAQQKHTRKHFVYVFLAGIATIGMIHFAGQSIDMQANKFPPNITFFVFSIMMMALIVLVIPYLNRFFDWIEKRRILNGIFVMYSTRSMTIFLYQVYAFNLTIRIARMLMPGDGIFASAIKSGICLLTTIPLCAGLAIVFGRIERIRIGQLKAS